MINASLCLWPIQRNDSSEAEIYSHQWLIKTGCIQKMASGIYAILPLGQRIINNIKGIIENVHKQYGCLEMTAPTLQPSELWKQSGRYDAYGKEMLKVHDRHNRELIYGPTAEEIFTAVVAQHATSYRHMPLILFNTQWKFRDEIRPRFGLMRGREFLMKDAYSFDIDEASALNSYAKMFEIYQHIFKKLGLEVVPVRASTGPIGGDCSHEFHALCPRGESEIFIDPQSFPADCYTYDGWHHAHAMTDEYAAEKGMSDHLSHTTQRRRSIELGHIFYFGTKYTQAMNTLVRTADNKQVHPHMGSYGIGVSRLVGAFLEIFHDDKGMRWPLSVAPFWVAFVPLSKETQNHAAQSARQFSAQSFEHSQQTLYDDRAISVGARLQDFDLLGIPLTCIFGRAFIEKQEVEVRIASDRSSICVPYEQLHNFINDWIVKEQQKLNVLLPHKAAA